VHPVAQRIAQLRTEIESLQRQRDKLVAACKAALPHLRMSGPLAEATAAVKVKAALKQCGEEV
jgi:hypothetical protein